MYIFIFAEGLSKLDNTYEGHIKLFSQFILVCIDIIAYTDRVERFSEGCGSGGSGDETSIRLSKY